MDENEGHNQGEICRADGSSDRCDFKQALQKTVHIVLHLSETFSVLNYRGRYIILGTKPGLFSSVENSVADLRAELSPLAVGRRGGGGSGGQHPAAALSPQAHSVQRNSLTTAIFFSTPTASYLFTSLPYLLPGGHSTIFF